MSKSYLTDDRVVPEVDDNSRLKAEMDAYKESGVTSWPAVTVNHVAIHGDLIPAIRVAEKICEKYSEKPSYCSTVDRKFRSVFHMDSETHYLAVVVIILVLAVVLMGMLYCYKRMMRREMNKEMNVQISQMVSQYFALSEGKSPEGKTPTDNLWKAWRNGELVLERKKWIIVS